MTVPRHPHTLADIRPVDLFVAYLDAGDFNALYAPFESRIPAVFLFGLPE